MSTKTIYASAARTATPTAVQVAIPRGCKGIRVVLDATVIAATPAVTTTIDTLDSVSGKWINLLTSAAVATVTTNTYVVALGVTVAANLSASAPLGDQVRITCTHGDADSITYSVGATLIR
jgi:hypothetical protein